MQTPFGEFVPLERFEPFLRKWSEDRSALFLAFAVPGAGFGCRCFIARLGADEIEFQDEKNPECKFYLERKEVTAALSDPRHAPPHLRASLEAKYDLILTVLATHFGLSIIELKGDEKWTF